MKNDSNRPGDPDAQEVDINDADVSAESEPGGAIGAAGRRTAPPPLPLDMMMPSSGAEQPQQMATMPQAASVAPSPSMAPPKPRSPMFYGILVIAFVVVGLGGGAIVAMVARRRAPPPPVSAAPAATRTAAVITIPVVEMDDQPDSGP